MSFKLDPTFQYRPGPSAPGSQGSWPPAWACGKRKPLHSKWVTRSEFQAGTWKNGSETGGGTISTGVLIPDRSTASAVKLLPTRMTASFSAIRIQSGRGVYVRDGCGISG